MRKHELILVSIILAVCTARAQPLSIEFRNSVTLGAAAVDQNGQSFTVRGLSGVTWLGGDQFIAVMDNSDKLVRLSVEFEPDGSIASASIAGGLTIAMSKDFEGVAFTDAARNSVLLAEENSPGVHEFSLADGALLQSLPVPAVFANRRSNLGFESLTRRTDAAELWTANEAALTVDGPVSTPANGTVVRLLHYTLDGGDAAPDVQYAYLTEPMHGGNISNGTSGVSDLVVLPNARLLVLERSFAFSIPNFFLTRIFEADFAGATDVSGFTDGLAGQSYSLAGKSLLFSGGLTNLEGVCLGPALPNGDHVLLGVVDDGDPISVNGLVSFALAGAIDPPCGGPTRCDMNCDGSVNGFDISGLVAALSGAAVCSPCAGDVNADGSINGMDIQPFIDCLAP